MSGSFRTTPAEPRAGVETGAIAAAYATLGAALVWSRLYSLGHSFWTDEILMVDRFVRAGLREIITGGGLTHQLMAILCWLAANTVGESELAFRLFSAVPFVAGVVLVTVWLHVRLGALAGILYLFLATVSPLLLDVTRQARGYGLAFFAMSVMVVAALEALRTGGVWAVLAMWLAGLMAAWTLPQAGIAVIATAVVLTLDRRTRLASAVGLALVLTAIGAWYVPHRDAIHAISDLPDGVQIDFPWVVTAPIDQIVLPGLLWIDGTALVAGAIWLPLIVLVAIVGARSPFMREWRLGAALLAGPVTTVLALWIVDSYVIPRYLSFLLAPLFIVLATGAATTLRGMARRRAVVGPVICLVALGLLAARFVILAPDVVGLPREALRDAAATIDEGPPATPVLAYMRHAQTKLGFYLSRPIEQLDEENVIARVCGQSRPVYYVEQVEGGLARVALPCLSRPDANVTVLRQYTRGDKISVWLVPPER
jgi:hypothetical protein